MTTRLILLPLAVIAVVACQRPVRPTPPPPLVTVAYSEIRDVRAEHVFIGRTESAQYVEVRARVEGFLETIEFEAGTDVEAGQVLFRIEKDNYSARRERAAADLAFNEAELERAKADLGRVEKALESKAVSEQEVGLRRADVSKAEAAVAVTKAQLREAVLAESYTDVVAPCAGRVGRERVAAGNLVGAGERTLLTTIAALDPIWVYFDLPESILTEALRDHTAQAADEETEKQRYPIRIALEGDQGFPHEGYIDYVSNVVDASTGTVRVRGHLDNDNLRLYPGLFARVQLQGRLQEGLALVEEAAIDMDLGGKFVLVVGEDMLVERRYVKLGPLSGGKRALLSGLEAGERYILEGQMRARPGLPVTIQDSAVPTDQGTESEAAVEDGVDESGGEDEVAPEER